MAETVEILGTHKFCLFSGPVGAFGRTALVEAAERHLVERTCDFTKTGVCELAMFVVKRTAEAEVSQPDRPTSSEVITETN